MRSSCSRRILAVTLAVMMLFGCCSFSAFAAEGPASSGRTIADLKELLNTISYNEYLEKHKDTPRATKTVSVNVAEYDKDATTAAVEVVKDYEGRSGSSVFFPDSGAISWKVNVPETAMYGVEVDYYPVAEFKSATGKTYEGKSASIERMLLVDGKALYSEVRTLSFTKVWANTYYEGADGAKVYVPGESAGEPVFRQDINGNDIRPAAYQAPEWRTVVVSDSTGYYSGGLLVCLEKGEVEISLEAVREPMILGGLRLIPLEEEKTMEEYVSSVSGSGSSEGAAAVKIQAEKPTRFSDDAIYPINDRTSAITEPQIANAQLLNMLGGKATYKTAGQWASYEFKVEKTGWYNIAARYKQNENTGMFSSRIVKIDGKVLYDECYNARFDYTKDWDVIPLGTGETVFRFWFEEGRTYTLELEVGLGEMDDIVREVEESLRTINSGYLEIIKLTGAKPDKYRTYNFGRVMPQVLVNFIKEARRLDRISAYLEELSGTKNSTLGKISYLLNEMGTDESTIAPSLETLKSYIGTLGTWLNNCRSQPLMVDYLLVTPESEKLPRANVNFFQAIWYEMKLFVSSFFVDYSNMGSTTERTEDAVEVWMTYGRDQQLVTRAMVDSMFTPDTGIAVDVKLVSAGTLLPSVLSNQGPDCFLGLSSDNVINFAIRSAILPLDQRPGFEEIMSEFTDSARIPLTLYNHHMDTGKTDVSVYGLPETMVFSMMFYRKDILADLGIELPKTWDDLIAAMTVLSANNLEIGLHRSYDRFLYQMGGNRYADFGMRAGIDSNVGLEAFQYYCRFFTDYSFPVTFDGANRFRTGEMPIVISPYAAMYNTLTVYATEIQGLWDFTVLPGYVREDGSINNVALGSVSAVVMLRGCEREENTWEFMKWYVGHDAQAQYCNQLITTIGPAAKHSTANREALADMAWTSGELEVILDQFDNIASVEEHPGSYIFNRYINFAFLAAYKHGKDPVEELRSYVPTINKEITRKRQEFGMDTLDVGQTLDSLNEQKNSGN